MKNVYMVQASRVYGGVYKAAYLPYAVGLLVAYAFKNEEVAASYSFKRFVFTREDIEDAAQSFEAPYFVGFSNYIWNTQYNLALAKRIKELYPSCLVLFGGHNVPPDTSFLEQYSFIDYLIHGEGEEAFLALLLELNKSEPDFRNVPNFSCRYGKGGYIETPVEVLTKTDYPSPYLDGWFDDIRRENPDLQLDAIIETSRGCPNKCAYCDWGCLQSKVKLFPLERVLKEIDWFSDNKIAFLWGADANFGLFERDMEIVDYIVEKRRTTGFPERIRTNYAKDKDERVFEISRKLDEYGLSKIGATLSFQSLNPVVLENIGRKNMDIEHFRHLMSVYRNAGVTTYSELILGLPGETYDSFRRGIGILLEAGQHRLINVYPCELLPNSLMGSKEYIEKFSIKTSVLPSYTSHCLPDDVDAVREKSCFIVATDTMPVRDWVRAAVFAAFESSYHHLGITKFISMYLFYELKVRYEDFYNDLLTLGEKAEDFTSLHTAFEVLDSFYSDAAAGKSKGLYVNPTFGEITWGLDHTAFLCTVDTLEDFYVKLSPFILSYGVEQSVWDELVRYQLALIKRPNTGKFSASFSYDWHGYFTEILAGNYFPLEKRANTLYVENSHEDDNWADYARNAVWFTRNGGTFNIELRQEY